MVVKQGTFVKLVYYYSKKNRLEVIGTLDKMSDKYGVLLKNVILAKTGQAVLPHGVAKMICEGCWLRPVGGLSGVRRVSEDEILGMML